jgi:hypothetical protein
MFEIGTATNFVDLLDRLDTFLTATGSAYGLAYAGTGDGTLTAYKGGADSIAETFTITATSATNFTVVGSVSGSIGPATVGTPFSHAKLAFTLTAGGTAFVSGDAFTLSTAPKWTTLRRSLGSKVLATQQNTGTYAAQNLVDGKLDGVETDYWRLFTTATLPQDVEITLYQEETIVAYELAEFVNWLSPKNFTFDYWNGSAWVTLDTRTNFAGVTGVVSSFAIASPVAATRYRLHITSLQGTDVSLSVIRLRRADGVDVATGQMLWKAPGNDGDSEIFVGAHPFERADADYFDLELFGFDGFVAASHLRLQPGAQGQLFLPLWNATIPYWFIADGRRVIVIAKINTQYEMAYLGLLDPYFSPEQWPYPLAVGGTLALGETPIALSSTLYRWSETSDKHRMPTHADTMSNTPPNLKPEDSQLRARNLDGTWIPFRATSNDAINAPGAYSNLIWPYVCGMNLLDVNLDGSYALWPVMLNASAPNTIGQLRGIAAVSGQGLTAETLMRKGAIDWMALHNITRTDRDDFLAVALD